MKANHKVTGRAMTIPAGIGFGVLASIAVTVLFSAALAALVLGGNVPQASVGYGSMVILLAASSLGGLAAFAAVKHRRLLVCMLTGLCYFAALLCCTALFFGGQYTGIGVTALLIAVGALVSSLAGAGERRGNKNGRRKIRSR